MSYKCPVCHRDHPNIFALHTHFHTEHMVEGQFGDREISMCLKIDEVLEAEWRAAETHFKGEHRNEYLVILQRMVPRNLTSIFDGTINRFT